MTTRLRRREWGSGHTYTLDDRKVDGVTSAIGKAYPINLKQWGADAAANYAIEHWDELAAEPVTKRLDRMRYAHRDLLAGAALRGTEIHALGERIVHGGDVEIPEHYRGPAEAYARFLDTWEIEPIASETPLANTEWGYAGTADLWCRIGVHDGAVALIDLKTGRSVYESTALQLAAYRHADLWQVTATGDDGPEVVESTDVPEVTEVYVAHVLSDDVELVPVSAGQPEFREFLYVLQTARWIKAHGWKSDEPVIGEALARPTQGAAS